VTSPQDYADIVSVQFIRCASSHSSFLSLVIASFGATQLLPTFLGKRICISFTAALIVLYPLPMVHSSISDFLQCCMLSYLYASCMVHTSLLHVFLFDPRLAHTPPFATLCLHPSLVHVLVLICAPCFTFPGLFCASFTAATLVIPCLTHTPPCMALFVQPSCCIV